MSRSRDLLHCGSDSDSSNSGSSSDSDFEDRHQKRKRTYLQGHAHKPYRITGDLSHAFEGGIAGPSSSEPTVSNVCNSCMPVLCKYAETFKGLRRQGSELKRRKTINPNPKKPDFDHYRDLSKHNVFDALGNYLFCSKCIHNALGVSYQRLSHQRKVKRAQFNQPIRRAQNNSQPSANFQAFK